MSREGQDIDVIISATRLAERPLEDHLASQA